MQLALGSRNPVKVRAFEQTAHRLWPDARLLTLNVAHGAAAQPLTREDTIGGAVARARLAREAADADIGVGLEFSVIL